MALGGTFQRALAEAFANERVKGTLDCNERVRLAREAERLKAERAARRWG